MTRFLVATVAAAITCAVALPVKAGLTECVEITATNTYVTACLPWHE